ncbi:MAG: hypothetical protein PHH26_01860 [Candidatus Thermoplasmatota archaeon]|nr:hypothetical protein [Candidatus Thermoplasmatota archaeon]
MPKLKFKPKKDDILMLIAIVILLASAMINWTILSWLTLLGVMVLLFAWYFKK